MVAHIISTNTKQAKIKHGKPAFEENGYFNTDIQIMIFKSCSDLTI